MGHLWGTMGLVARFVICRYTGNMLNNGLENMIVDLEDRSVTLNKEQLDAYETLTKLQRGVTLAHIAGKPIDEAHRAAGGKSRDESRRITLAGEILRHPASVHFLSTMAVDPSPEIASAVLSRDELLMGLTNIARTNLNALVSFSERLVCDVETGEEFTNSVVHIKSSSEIPVGAWDAIKTIKQTKNGLELVLHDGLNARKQIAEMCGYNAPTKTEITGPGGAPIQVQDVPDEEVEQRLESLGLGRYHNQLGAKRKKDA